MFRPVRRIGVEIRAAGHGQAERAGHLQIAIGRDGVLFAVVCLERIETVGREFWNPFVMSDEGWMGQRRHPTCVVHMGEYLRRWSALARHERRTAARQPSIEGLVGGCDMA